MICTVPLISEVTLHGTNTKLYQMNYNEIINKSDRRPEVRRSHLLVHNIGFIQVKSAKEEQRSTNVSLCEYTTAQYAAAQYHTTISPSRKELHHKNTVQIVQATGCVVYVVYFMSIRTS